MAYKDEYEVARLYTNGEFRRQLSETFENTDELKLVLHLAPPILAKRDAQGHAEKSRYGQWIWYVLPLLAKLKCVRGTPMDVFGRTAERRMERQLIEDYRASIARALQVLSPATLQATLELARLPEQIRGFGHIKDASIVRARARWAELELLLHDRGTSQSESSRNGADRNAIDR